MSELFLGHHLTDRTQVLLDRDDFCTHGVVVGCTGSGKTGLVHVVIEEAVMQGASAVVLDPKGDLTNLLLAFPSLTAEEFAPWVPAGKGAVEEAAAWRNGLKETEQDEKRVMEWRNAATFRVFTPGYAGAAINLLPSLARPSEITDATRGRAQHIVDTVLSALGIDADTRTDPRSVFLTDLLMHAWKRGRDLPLEQWAGFLSQPPDALSKFDGICVNDFFPRKDRMKLASAIVGFRRQAAQWLEGPPMDMNSFLMPGSDGRPQVSIFTFPHLSDEDAQLFSSMFLSGLVDWMRSVPASGRLRALCVLDEASGYLPPVAKPPTKKPICTILAKGRSQGLGMLLATQNPNDIDYKALSNVRTWFLGGLRDRDLKRDLDALLRERNVKPETLLNLPERTFMLLTKDRQSIPLKTRWSLSYLRGPIAVEDIHRIAPTLPRPEAPPTRLEVESRRLPSCQGLIEVGFDLIDPEGSFFTVKVTYSTDNGKTWKQATPDAGKSNPILRLRSSPTGVHHTFDWNSVADLGHRYCPGVLIHIKTDSSGGITLPPFDVCNNQLEEDDFSFLEHE